MCGVCMIQQTTLNAFYKGMSQKDKSEEEEEEDKTASPLSPSFPNFPLVSQIKKKRTRPSSSRTKHPKTQNKTNTNNKHRLNLDLTLNEKECLGEIKCFLKAGMYAKERLRQVIGNMWIHYQIQDPNRQSDLMQLAELEVGTMISHHSDDDGTEP